MTHVERRRGQVFKKFWRQMTSFQAAAKGGNHRVQRRALFLANRAKMRLEETIARFS